MANQEKSPLRTAALLAALLFAVYNANLRAVHTDDSIPTRLLPFALLVDHTFYLDRWVAPYLPGLHGPYGIYFVLPYKGHWLSAYPLINPLVFTPAYLLPARWLSRLDPPPKPGDIVLTALIDVMEKLSASLMAAISAAILFLALRRVVKPAAAVMVSLIYALASSTWSISSQALWKHGFEEVCFASLLWTLLADDGRLRYAVGVGLAAGAAANNTPPYALVALLLVPYFMRNSKRLAAYSSPVALLGIAALAYNHHFSGHFLGMYPNPVHPPNTALYRRMRSSFGDALMGLAISPNRGLLIYSPWVLVALWGAWLAWCERSYAWERWLMVAAAFIYLGYAEFSAWWGGLCYGPRYLVDLLPFIAYFLARAWGHVERSHLLQAGLAAAVVVSIWVQAVGAFNFPRGRWDMTPRSVNYFPGRLWDWRDTQISRTWAAGPAQPEMLYQLFILLGANQASSEARKSAGILSTTSAEAWPRPPGKLPHRPADPAGDIGSGSHARLQARAGP